jgi:hypothetical protein
LPLVPRVPNPEVRQFAIEWPFVQAAAGARKEN